MWIVMKKIADKMDSDKVFRSWIGIVLPFPEINSQLVRCLKDPTDNILVKKMIEDFYKLNSNSPDWQVYLQKLRTILDNLILDIKKELNIG